jgi:hypothetical protein
MKTTFKEIVHKSPEWTNAVKLREKILREPLGSIFTDQELEEERYHFQIAGFVDDTIIATAVLVAEGDVELKPLTGSTYSVANHLLI